MQYSIILLTLIATAASHSHDIFAADNAQTKSIIISRPEDYERAKEAADKLHADTSAEQLREQIAEINDLDTIAVMFNTVIINAFVIDQAKGIYLQRPTLGKELFHSRFVSSPNELRPSSESPL